MTKLPKEWDIKPLEEIAIVERGKFSARPRNDPRYYGGNIPFVQTGDIAGANGRLSCYTQSLNEAGLAVSRLFPANTILITIAANIGDAAITTFPVACPDSLVGIQAKNGTDINWLLAYIQTRKPDLEAAATQNAQKNINLQVLRPLNVICPPEHEQKEISKIIKTCNQSIEVLEQLISSKREHKRALMQRLLIGKLRFPEFASKPWNHTQLGKISSLIKKAPLSSVDGETLLTVKLYCKGIERNERITARLSEKGRPYFRRHAGEFIIGRQNFHNGGFAILPMEMDGLIASSAITSMEIDAQKALDKFVFYYLSREEYYSKAGDRIGGTGQKEFSDKELLTLPIYLPELVEQRKIVAILSAADREIEQLTQKLDAYKQQKKGLMQQLLTGKKRVKLDHKEAA